jgi:hypothetical protein
MDIQTYQLTVDETLVENVINLSTIIPSSTGLSNKGGWQGVITNQQIDWVESIRHTIEQVTDKKTERFWFNINGPGHFNDWHRHFSNCDAAVFYIKIPPQSGNIEFREQEEILSITPTVGTLFVFPGMLEHRVTVNESQDIRISLATNLK